MNFPAGDKLDDLPVKNGFRLRGMDMTRTETFTDAAFAFALTLLVVSVVEGSGRSRLGLLATADRHAVLRLRAGPAGARHAC